MPFLAGFDARWQDAADYLAALTHDLSEAHRLDRAEEYLAPDVLSHDGCGARRGPVPVAADLAARRAAFPDLVFLHDETLWTSTAHNAFVAAQRFQAQGRHDGPGLYGLPTGAALSCAVMSERWCASGRVQEQWQVWDEAAVVRQLGLSEETAARYRLKAMRATGTAGDAPPPEKPRLYSGTGDDDAWGHTLGDMVHRAMGGELSVIERHYDAAAELNHPGGVTGLGRREAAAFWIALRAAFPSAEFRVEHTLGTEEPLSSPRAAIRWSLRGRHDGHGALGAPTGAPVEILGMTQAEFGPGGLRREWTLFDSIGARMQIMAATG